MTAVCVGGGTSSIKLGQAEVVIFGAGAIASVLNNRGAFWASVVAPLMGVLQFELTQMCTQDPPPMPSISALEVTEMLAVSGVLASDATKQKFNDLVTNILWYQLCQCDAGAAPVPPAVPAAPAGLPDATRLYSGTGIGMPCATAFNNAQNSQNTGVYLMLENPDQNGNQTQIVLPSGGHNIRVSASLTPHGSSHCTQWNSVVRWFTAGGGSNGSTIGPVHPTDGNVYFDDFVDPGVSQIAWVQLTGGTFATLTDLAFAKADVYCGGAPGSIQAACCPADQYQTAMMQQILDYVTLLQRQLAPFAYVSGAVHAGLTGDGEFDIQGLLGAKVALTTIPSSRGVALGQPDELFDIGFITFGVPDGYPHSMRIDHNPQVFMPARASAFTKLAYSLTPGVVATITELSREK